MNKKGFIEKAGRVIGRAGLKFRKHSPELLLLTGFVCGGVAVYKACKASMNMEGAMAESNERLDNIRERIESRDVEEKPVTKEEKRELTVAYAKAGLDVAKLYSPAIGWGVLSSTCILASHNILKQRNLALTATYAAVSKSFKDYRQNVVDRFGEALDRELKYNITTKEVEETVIDDKGKTKKVKKHVEIADPNMTSEYARYFDSSCKGWDEDPEVSLFFLRSTQDYANDLLRVNGYLFLNDVFDMLGIPRTKAGQIVGWIYDEDGCVGDNFVDFGIYNLKVEKNREFVNGLENVVLLDFNVDGDILNKI